MRAEVSAISERGVTLVESLTSQIVGRTPKRTIDGAVRNLTICGMTLVVVTARSN